MEETQTSVKLPVDSVKQRLDQLDESEEKKQQQGDVQHSFKPQAGKFEECCRVLQHKVMEEESLIAAAIDKKLKLARDANDMSFDDALYFGHQCC